MQPAAEERVARTATVTSGAPLARRLDGIPQLQALLGRASGVLAGVPAGAVSLLAWWLRERTGRTVVVLSADPELVYGDVLAWSSTAVGLFPEADAPPFDRVPASEEVTRRRIATLAMLRDPAAAIVGRPARKPSRCMKHMLYAVDHRWSVRALQNVHDALEPQQIGAAMLGECLEQ